MPGALVVRGGAEHSFTLKPWRPDGLQTEIKFSVQRAYATMSLSAEVALRSSWEIGAGRPNR